MHDLATEKLLQAFGLCAAFVGGCPAVVVVHVEDQVDGLAPFDDTRQQQAGEEALARAAFAEHTDRALDQPLEVEVDLGGFQFQRRTDVEVRVVLRTEHGVHIFDGGVEHLRKVTGDGLDGSGCSSSIISMGVTLIMP